MQPLIWYVRRLRSMEPSELPWRARGLAQTLFDPYLLGRRERDAAAGVSTIDCSHGGGFSVSSLTPGAWCTADATALERHWATRLRQRADRILAGHFRLFDLDDFFLGDPIDWNKDHKHGIETPRGYSARIDYRDFRVAGDAKFVWEPNRHHALVLLGRAYRATGEPAYARRVIALLEQWFEQCPYGHGMNWRVPLELAVRLINWVWALDLIRPAGVMTADFERRVLTNVSLHLREITHKYSRGTSANNHRIGEAAGVFIASAYFHRLPGCNASRQRSFRILAEEIERQTFPDGGNREQSLGYHLFVLQFFVLAGLVARRTGQDFDQHYWNRLARMCRFLAAFCEAGSPAPRLGDSDDGYVLDLDADPCDPVPWLALPCALFEDDDSQPSALAPAPVEVLSWLPLENDRSDEQRRRPHRATLSGHAFPDSGYYLLQHGQREHSDRISVVFDCGPLGSTAIAAHGHADALSLTLRAAGADVLIDPGTYDYFTHPQWRDYFRSTRAHNTVLVDAVDQSVMLGPFLWGRRAQARCLEWRATDDGGWVVGEHDGYTRLADPVIHRRTLELRGNERTLIVTDDLVARGRHSYTQLFHLAAQARITAQKENCIEIDFGPARATLTFDEQLRVTALHGSESPRAGWMSIGYHRIASCVTLVGECAHRGRLRLRTQIVLASPVDAGR